MNRFSEFQRFFPQYAEKKYTARRIFNSTDDNFKLSVFHSAYNKPTKRDVLIIIPFFNPCNSVRMLQNLLLVRSKLEQSNIPFVIIHCLFPNSAPLGEETTKYMIVRSSSYAFIKENLGNIAINKYKEAYSKFLIHDCDIIYEDKDWYDKVSESLDEADIVQPYEVFKNLDKNFLDFTKEGLSTFSVHHKQKDNVYVDSTKGHPGYLIAFTKDFWQTHCYPDENLIGGGDTLICSLALKKKLFENHNNANHMEYVYNKYINDKEIKTNFVNCTIYHLYHNITSNRQYTTRYLLLKNFINDRTPYNSITDIIVRNEDNVYEWIEDIREELSNDILNYFVSRDDDEVPFQL